MARGSGPELRGRIGIDGEEEFKKKLNEAGRSVGVVNSELRLLSAQFKAGGESQELYAKKADALKAKLAAQQQQVAVMEQVLAAVKTEYGKDSEEAQKYTVKLNGAKAALATTEAEIRKNEEAMQAYAAAQQAGAEGADDLANAADKGGESVKDAGKNAKDAEKEHKKLSERIKDLAKAAGHVLVAGFKAGAAAVAAMGTAAVAAMKGGFDLSVSAGKAADDLATLSVQTGVSTQSLQRWGYASNFIDTSLDTITGSMTKMTKEMGEAANGSDGAAKKFDTLGVSITDSHGRLRDSEEVFWDAIDALGKIQNPTERDAAAMELFGKSAQELNPLIEAGSAGFQELGMEADKLGVTFSDEMVSALGGFDDSMQKANAASAALQNTIGYLLVPAFQPLADAATTAMADVTTALQDGLQPGEAEALVQDIVSVAAGMVDQISGLLTGAMPLVTAAVTGLVGAAAEALPGLLTTLTAPAMELLTGVVDAVSANVAPLAGAATALITSLGGFLAENAGTLTTAAAELVTSLLTGLTEALPTLIPAGVSAITSIISGLTEALPTLVAALPQVTGAIIDGILATDWLGLAASIIEAISTGLVSAVTTIGDTISSIGTSIWDGLVNGLTSAFDLEAILSPFTGIVDGIKNLFGIHSPSTVLAEIGGFLLEGLGNGLTAGLDAVLATVGSVFGAIWDGIKGIFGVDDKKKSADDAQQAGADIMAGIQDGITGGQGGLTASGADAARALLDGFDSVLTETACKAIGAAVTSGVALGIANGTTRITAAARAAARAAYDAARHELDIHSPSRKMRVIGQYYTAGFAEGIESKSSTVVRAAAALTTKAAGATQSAMSVQRAAIDYDRLGMAVARANRAAGVGTASLYVGKRRLSQAVEPGVMAAAGRRSAMTIGGRPGQLLTV